MSRFYQLDKNKKATINLINKKYNKCFQYAVTVALNHKKGKEFTILALYSKIQPFIGRYNWERISYPSEKRWLEKFEKNSPMIALSVL